MVAGSKITQKIRALQIEGSKSLTIAWLILIVALSLCVLFPLVCVALTPKATDFRAVLSSAVWKGAVKNTFVSCVSSTALSVAIGYVYAYAIVYGEIPMKRFFRAIPLLHLVTPPFVGGLSFILLLGRKGFITNTLLGLDVTLYGFRGLLIAQSLCFFPLAYMICSENLKNINHSLELAAYGMGASGSKIFRTITLPLSFPGIVASFLFIAVSVMSDFGNPMIVAGRYRVLAVEIYTQLTGWVKAGTSAVLGIFLVVPSAILFFLQNKITRKNMARLGAIGSRGFSATGKKRSLSSRVFLTLFCALVSLCVLAQFAAIIAGSFQKVWGVNTAFTLNHVSNLTKYTLELKNSIAFALLGATISTLLAASAAYMVFRTKCPLKKLIDTAAQIPAAVPGTLFGLAFSLCASKLNFHRSNVLIVIAIAVGFLPFSYRILSSSFAHIKTSLDDAARSLGANRLQVLSSIILPLSHSALFDAFIYDFVRGVGTMSAVIFLVSFNTPLTAIKILNLAEQGFWGDAAALALLLTIITFAILGMGKIAARFLKKRRKWWIHRKKNQI